jgi:hypothetical protein
MMCNPTSRGIAAAAASLLLGALGTACNAGNPAAASNTTQRPTHKTTHSAAPAPTVKPTPTTARSPKTSTGTSLRNTSAQDFNPKSFGNPIAGGNEWIPLKPGWQTIKKGLVNIGSRRLQHVVVYTVTDVSKMIAGVRTVVILDQDFNGGQLAEQALDFVAEDKHGNIWYLGSYTEAYEGGQFVYATDGWLAGVNGSQPGILMEALPHTGLSYIESDALGEGPQPRQVINTGQSKCVPFRCFKNLLVIQEGSSGEEYKYYARGVGQILTEPNYSGGKQETELLVNARQLSPRGLAELSSEVIKLDRHARSVVPDVFATSSPAKRTL